MRIVAIFCVALILAGASFMWTRQAPRDIVTATERQTGADLCGGKFSATRTELTLSGVFVGNDHTPCVAWDGAVKGLLIWSGTVEVGGRELPVVIYRRRLWPLQSDQPHRIFVRVVGGPGGSIAPNAYDSLYTNLLGTNDILVNIGYTGTKYGSLYPESDFDTASAEVAAFSRQLHLRNPGAKLVLIGESLGGAIAAAAAQPSLQAAVHSRILVAPLAFSPAEAQENFTVALQHDYKNDAKETVRVLSQPEPSGKGQWTPLNTIELFSHFFPAASQQVDLEARLRASDGVPTLVVYGAEDDRAGAGKFAAIGGIDHVRTRKIERMGHVLDPKRFDEMTAAMEEFLASTDAGG